MRLIRGIHNIASAREALKKGCVLTIGNFDGVHLGHQKIVNQVTDKAKQLGLPSVVMLFEPLPVEYFAPKSAPVRLMNLREKLEEFKLTPVDFVMVCRFDDVFASFSAETFVKRVLVEQLNVKEVVIGDDFRFGAHRKGDYLLLTEFGQTYGFGVTDQMTLVEEGERVSSTRIRQALAEHDLSKAERLLNKPFYFKGRVIHGKKLGRKLGFRTLNLNPKRLQMPLQGVYSVYVCGLSEQKIPGVANVGVRPTVHGLRPSIEVHMFNWNEDVYGRHVGVEIHQFIREERRFESLDHLKEQIEQDVSEAKKRLALI